MNATLTRETRHPLQPAHTAQPVRRVGLVDRAALHLGVALIKFGRRPVLASYERRANLLERALAHAARDARVAAERDRAVLNYSQLTLVR
ncbi:MAG TPA: hypothetical protein VNR36_03340 [Pseudolysinimonas sp.]|nr:hypothetical protein [Pseudolysinimonas sp.]